MKFVKIIRDKIGRDEDKLVYARIKDRQIFLAGMKKKLVEEATEYLISEEIEELVDVLEVVEALAKFGHGISIGSLTEMAVEKKSDRGGFDMWRALCVETD